jgi:hypothetical protein
MKGATTAGGAALYIVQLVASSKEEGEYVPLSKREREIN